MAWAPPFPRWLHRPGFWDPVHLLQHEIAPCFSVALLDGNGVEIRLRGGPSAAGVVSLAEIPVSAEGRPRGSDAAWVWRPGRLTTGWSTDADDPRARSADDGRSRRTGGASSGDDRVEEIRRILPGGILESLWAGPPVDRARYFVALTAQPAGSVSDMRRSDGGVAWMRKVTDRAGVELAVGMEIVGSVPPAWRSVRASEGRAVPDWARSPFAEGVSGQLALAQPADEVTAALPSDDIGWIWIAVAFSPPPPDESPLALRMLLAPRLPRPLPARANAFAEDGAASPLGWKSFFAGFPAFACGDAHLDRYFDYRVHGLGLNRIEGSWGNVRRAAIAEGPEYFHVPIAYSAQCHMMEMRWRAGGREAWGSLLNFVDNQKLDGSFHGRLYPDHLERTDFYHANWGDALLAVDDMHPDPVALVRCYESLSRYARWLNGTRDPEGSGMFTVVNHFETGQEYMSRYMAVDDEADVAGWRPRLRLKGIDVTVYAHQLFRALAVVAGRIGRPGDEAEWRALQARSANAIAERMWCPEARFFTDVDGRSFVRTGVKAAVGFYPLLTGLVAGRQLDAMLDHLEDPSTFGTPFPLPSSSVDDPRFSAEGIWRGKRRNCPWNGRVWPMTTSHVIEGLLRHWRRGDDRAGELAAGMLPRFVRMMFTDGDPRRPNCFEHYNPYTGHACHFRGIEDYQHSWVLDLLARGIAGLHVDASGVEVRPLPHGCAHVSLGPVAARGRAVSVALDEDHATLAIDGERHSGPRGAALRVGWRAAGS